MTVKEKIEALNPWFHNVHLPDGSETAPEHFLGDFPKFKWEQVKGHIPEDLNGWSVLDIGCNAGFYAIELAKRGADVLAIDLDEQYLKQAKFVADQFDLRHKIDFRLMQVYDLHRLERKFDLIWFMGVFYHLRYPLLAMDIISKKVNKLLVFQTMIVGDHMEGEVPENVPFEDRATIVKKGWPALSFVENKLAGDPTNWWIANPSCASALLRDCGFKLLSQPDDETFVAAPVSSSGEKWTQSWNSSEYLSAIGKEWRFDIHKKTKNK